jgi:putative polyketide hydroxylase
MNGRFISTLDLYRDGFVLMAGHDGAGWIDAAKQAGQDTGVDVTAYVVAKVGSDEPLADIPTHREKISSPFSKPFPACYNIETSGAVLVRPDGYVGWRQKQLTPDAGQNLAAALNQILCR